jgi:hypothetical protein
MKNKTIAFMIIILFCWIFIVIGIFFIHYKDKTLIFDESNSNYSGQFKTNDSNILKFANASEIGILYSNYSLLGNTKDYGTLNIAGSNGETNMIIYSNGSYWIREGTEKENGEQLAKVVISYSSYIKGFCEGIKQ